MTPMYAVVSLLDQEHYRRVEQLWAELREHCGVAGIFATPFPHFSYHVAAGYDLNRLERRLRRFCRTCPPFTVRTSGLGVFTGPNSVLYVPVVRSQGLSRVHQQIWPRVEAFASGSVEYYHPERWMPHITLGHGDLCQQNLPATVGLLGARSFSWEIPVDNLAVISSCGSAEGLHMRMPMGQ